MRTQGKETVEGKTITIINNNINGATLKWSWSCHNRGIACLTYHIPQVFAVLKPGKITLGWALRNLVLQRTVCKDSKKAVILTTGLMITRLKIKNNV